MNLVNKQVEHKSFGKGRIIKHSDSYIEVQFSLGNKKFVFPDVFNKYLMLNDKRASDIIDVLLREKGREAEAEAKLKKVKALERREQRKILRQEKLVKNKKSHPSTQVVFWCREHDWDKIFMDWNVFTGVIKSGLKKVNQIVWPG